MAEERIEQLAPGRVIEGHYRIEKVIFRGSAATVYKATQLNLDRPVAIKYLHGQAVQDDELRNRFVREARALADLRHSAIVPIFDCGIDDGAPFFVLEYQEAPTLRALLSQAKQSQKGKKKKGKIEVAQALAICRHIVDALSWSHEKSIIHRDVTPANIFVRPDGQALLGDFGMARIEKLTTLTVTGSSLGSLGYRPPEVIDGQGADVRSDVFQVGLVLHEMLTGTNPGAQRAMAQLNPLAKDDGIVFDDIDGVPQWCNDIIRKCLSREPQDRYQTMNELQKALAGPRKKKEEGALRTGSYTPTNDIGKDGKSSAQGALRRVVGALFLLFVVALAIGWPREKGQVLELQSVRVEAGIERARVKVRANLPCLLFVRFGEGKVQGEGREQEHEIVLAPLTAGKAYQVQVEGQAEVDGKVLKATSITHTVTPYSKPIVRRLIVTRRQNEISIRLEGPKYSALTSKLVGPDGKEHACVVSKAEGGAVLLTASSLAPGVSYVHRWFVTDKVGTSLPQEEMTLSTLPEAKTKGSVEQFLGLYLHGAIEGKIDDDVFGFLKAMAPGRICFVWPPSTDVSPVIDACKRFQRKGWSTDVLVHVQRVPKSRKKLLDSLKALLQQSGNIPWLYVGHFVDWGGWQSGADELGRLMKTIAFFAKRLSPSTRVRLGPVALSKDLSYFGGLVSGKSISEDNGFSMAVIPSIYDKDDVIGDRLKRYRSRAEDMGCFKLPWSAFLQQTISIQSVVDENVSFLRPMAVDVDKGKLPGTDETHSVFAAPVTTGAVAAASLIDNIARCGVAGSETVYFQPSLQWCRKFSGKGKGPLEDPILWSAWSNVLYWMGGLKRISLANDKTLEKYGLALTKENSCHLYELALSNGQELLLLCPQKEKVLLTSKVERMKSVLLVPAKVAKSKSDDTCRAVTSEYRFNALDEVLTCSLPTLFFAKSKSQ